MLKQLRTLLFISFIFLCRISCSAQASFLLELMPPSISSPYDEITPVLSRDGKTLYFTRVGSPDFERTKLAITESDLANSTVSLAELAGVYAEISGEGVADPVASSFNQDIWVVDLDNNLVKNIAHPGQPLNNIFPNSLVSLTPDPKAFYVVNKINDEGLLEKGFSVVRKEQGGLWSMPMPVAIEDYYTITSDVSLTMSGDGKILLLSAIRKGEDNMDLFVCFSTGKDTWSAPQSLGTTINTSNREVTPFLSDDNRTLFFASNRGSNDLDIFMSKRKGNDWSEWTEPKKLDAPINSVYDDSQPFFNLASGYLYFTSRRNGNSDIFRVPIAPPSPMEIKITGSIIDLKTDILLSNSLVEYSATYDTTVKGTFVSKDGKYSIVIPKGVEVNIRAEKPGYLSKTTTVFIGSDARYMQTVFVYDLEMERLALDAKIELGNIYFVQSKAIIKESSFPELERLLQILQKNAKLQILIEGHTDNNGKEHELIKLSEDRALAIQDYLVKKGIDPTRLKTKGYGASSPLSNGTSEVEIAKNRRVEFRITKI